MRYVAAYMLVALNGKEPTAKEIKKVLSSVGITAEDDQLNTVLNSLKGKNLEEVVSEGMGKLASMPSGGGAAAAPAAGGAAASSGAAAAPKAEEKKPEPESESDDDMGFDLFG